MDADTPHADKPDAVDPSQKPELGLYYHYKHDPAKGINEHAYRVLGVGMHSEERTFTVVYRPLYPAPFLRGADLMCRPLEMFMEDVTKDGKTFSRFMRITDPDLIAKLEAIESEMYPN